MLRRYSHIGGPSLLTSTYSRKANTTAAQNSQRPVSPNACAASHAVLTHSSIYEAGGVVTCLLLRSARAMATTAAATLAQPVVRDAK